MTNHSFDVVEAARALALALQKDERWRTWNECASAFERDAELLLHMDRYRQLAGKAKAETAGGEGLSSDELAEIAKIQKAIQQNSSFTDQNAATAQLMIMLQEANNTLSTELGFDFAASISLGKP